MGCCCDGGSKTACCSGGSKTETVILIVEGMSCGHCKAAVEKAVSAIDGVSNVEVDLASKQVKVAIIPDKVNTDDIRQAITDQGYDVV